MKYDPAHEPTYCDACTGLHREPPSRRPLRSPGDLDWCAFMEHLVRSWRSHRHADIHLVSYLGMKDCEYAWWVVDGQVSSRVRRVWAKTFAHWNGRRLVTFDDPSTTQRGS